MTSKKTQEAPLIVIVGPTASGKTALAIDLAKKYNGEIICADSRTVYKYMDIGTAKPTHEERAVVPHWGLDLIEPNQRFTASDFQGYAYEKINDIRARGKVPFLVGGTGLYIDAVVFSFQFGSDYSEKLREQLDKMSINELKKYCNDNGIELPENENNKRYLVRAVEQRTINKNRQQSPLHNTYIVGITTDKAQLRTRIEQRTEQLFANGVVEEAITLGNKYGWTTEAMTGNIYSLMQKYLRGDYDISELKMKFMTRDWQLAKRQMTWFKRNKFIQWHTLHNAKTYISRILDMHQES